MSRLPGKKIDTWEWSKDKQVFKVDVRMASDSRAGGVHFGVIVPDLDINIWNKNIDELRRQVFAELDTKVSIEWQPFLHVQVSGDTEILKLQPNRVDDDDDDDDEVDNLNLQKIREQRSKARSASASLRIEIQNYELATSPTGQKLSRQTRYAREDWPEVGRKERSSRYSDQTEMEVAALVPDNPANREALNQLSRELQRLIDRLVELCEPKVIEQTLAAAVTTRLLTSGEKNE